MRQGNRLIDFHAHILPNADHGCKSVKMCLNQLEIAKSFDVGTVVATPHFYPHIHDVESFLERRERALKSIEGVPQKVGIDVIPGAEVQLCIGLDRMEGLEKLCIKNTNVLLLEIPDMPISRDMFDTIARLNKKTNVLIAHADRYTQDVTNVLLDAGYKIQLNTDSLFDLRGRRRAKRIIDTGLVFALGSDIHGEDKVSYKHLKASEKYLGDKFPLIQERMEKLLSR